VSRPAIVGVDPGGQTSGFAVRIGDQCVAAALVENTTGRDGYLDELAEQLDRYWTFCGDLDGPRYVAVEDVRHPSPHLGTINVAGLLETAVGLGAVLAWCRTWQAPVVTVPPGGHGTAPLTAYPRRLVGEHELGEYGKGRMKHARSAWDIAGAARTLLAYRSGVAS